MKYVKGGLFVGVKFNNEKDPLFKHIANIGGVYTAPDRQYYLKSIVKDTGECLVGFRIAKEYTHIDMARTIELIPELIKAMKKVIIYASEDKPKNKKEILELINRIGVYACYGEFRK